MSLINDIRKELDTLCSSYEDLKTENRLMKMILASMILKQASTDPGNTFSQIGPRLPRPPQAEDVRWALDEGKCNVVIYKDCIVFEDRDNYIIDQKQLTAMHEKAKEG